jgi:para-aminobenzoate synthetase component 1
MDKPDPKNQHECVFFFPGQGERGCHLLGYGVESMFEVETAVQNSWRSLDSWISQQNDWVFCWLCYDGKNSIERLTSTYSDKLKFPQLMFVVPQHVVKWNETFVEVLKGEWSEDFRKFSDRLLPDYYERVDFTPRLTKEEYLFSVQNLLSHIQAGDIYEVNFCQEFFAEQKITSPLNTWKKLRELTMAPHSAFVQFDSLYAMCASPERYLAKTGSKVISQPIKGTIRRGASEMEDNYLKHELLHNPKERSENVMIVDLVRNDLSKSAQRGTVKVEELFGVHTFKTVHHLMSTIASEPKPGTTFSQLICDTFPMGSMTGAPKVSAMKLIDQYEHSNRGLYSGTMGYITPDGGFDLNVVIRTVLYNDALPYVSYHVGGAITAQCDPEQEYQECLLKAQAMMKALS